MAPRAQCHLPRHLQSHAQQRMKLFREIIFPKRLHWDVKALAVYFAERNQLRSIF
jgi:hypothetical protein